MIIKYNQIGLSLLIGTLAFAACSQKSDKRGRNSDSAVEDADSVEGDDPSTDDSDGAAGPKKPSDADTLAFEADTGIKSGTQIFNSFTSVTGVAKTALVPATVAGGQPVALQAFFDADLLTAMPLESKIQGFGPGNQSAIIKLAIATCHAMVEDPALSAAFFPGVNLAQLPAAFTGKAAVAKALISKFWGTADIGLDRAKAEASVVALETALFGGLAGTAFAGTAQGTKNVVKGACGAVAGSFPSIIL